jgi:hypothetical protein
MEDLFDQFTEVINSFDVAIELPESDSTYAFITADPVCQNITDDEGDFYVYESPYDGKFFWERLGELGVDGFDYSGHFGYAVFFKCLPDNKDRCVKIVKELLMVWINAYEEAGKRLPDNCTNQQEAEAADAAYEFVEQKIEELKGN